MTKQPGNAGAAKPKELTEEEINAKIALTGNLADLSPERQMGYYARYCAHLGLDPITRPFDLLTTFEENGTPKTVLYANASCSAQLADKRQVTYSKPELEYNEKLGLLTINVQAMVSVDHGMIRSCWRRGVAHVEGLKGKRLENAIKKAETQAHRRATLALCGVAMPDESEIEDIPGAHTSPLQLDSATGGIYEKIGDLIRARNLEDSSGLRRYFLDSLVSGKYRGVAQMLGIDVATIEDLARMIERKAPPTKPVEIPTAKEIFEDPRPLPDTPLPEAWTGDTAAREIADQEIANKISAGLKTIHDEVKAEAPKPATPDPVPALAPTLTPAQQKVADASMVLMREHKKERAEIVEAIREAVGRSASKSSELSDEEAEKAFAVLQTWASTLAGLKHEPTKTKYGQKNPAHNAEIAKELDEVMKRLTILRVPFGPLLEDMVDLVEREVSGRKITTRYELDDDEAQAVLIFLRERIVEAERKASEKPAEV